MYSCTRKDERTLFFVNQKNGKTCSILFPLENNQRAKIIGVSGKALTKKPSYAEELISPALKQCRGMAEIVMVLQVLVSYCATFQPTFLKESYGADADAFAEQIVRYFETNGMTYDSHVRSYFHIVDNAINHARQLYRTDAINSVKEEHKQLYFAGLNSLEDVDKKFFELTRYGSYNKIIKLGQMHTIKQRIDNILPPQYQGDYTVEQIINKLLNDLSTELVTVDNFAAICQGFKTNCLQNLWVMYNDLGSSFSMVVSDYLRNCALIDKTPRFVSNFVKEYSDTVRTVQAQKDNIFASKQLEKPLEFSSCGLTVIIPLSIGCLIEEGEKQHNCVGNYGYDKKVIQGKCNIVFIRKESDPLKPYITCEISAKGEIIQFLTANNNPVRDTAAKLFKTEYEKHLRTIFK